jgi:transcription elongation factor Elf1
MIHEKKHPHIKVEKNKTRTGCIATAQDLHQTFTCNECNQKDQSNCIAFKINEVLIRKINFK